MKRPEDGREGRDADAIAQDEHEFELASEIFDHFLERCDATDCDPSGAGFDLWVQLARFLAEAGWTPEELIREAGWHAAHQTSDGRA